MSGRSSRAVLPFALSSLYLTFMAMPVQAHHSAAAFNTNDTVEVMGTITEYSYRNPHVYMTVTVNNGDGIQREVEVEAGAASVIAPLGFSRDDLGEGDVVTVIGNPSRRYPDTLLLGRELYKQDGTYFPLNISSRSVDDFGDAVADSLAGTWFPPRTSFFGYLGGANSWPLTPAGQAKVDSFVSTDTTHKDCIPIGTPGLMVYPVAIGVEVFDDRVVMDVDWLDSVRTIWLDGREHPAGSEKFLLGHSIGHWEDDVLVVESTNFEQHPMGLTMSLPSSEEKILTERFELSADGRQMLYSGTISDSQYLAEPVNWESSWVYRPGMPHSTESCDAEAATRFLDD